MKSTCFWQNLQKRCKIYRKNAKPTKKQENSRGKLHILKKKMSKIKSEKFI